MTTPLWPLFLPSAAEMTEFDRFTTANGVSSDELVRKAGEALYHRILSYFAPQTTVVACGPGNNGADGIVVARLFRQNGKEVTPILGSARRYSPELLEGVQKYVEEGGTLFLFPDNEFEPPPFDFHVLTHEGLRDKIRRADLLIDALLGTGQREAARGTVRQILEEIQRWKQRGTLTVSVDIPTGVNGDTGSCYDPHIVADRTICVEFIKRGLLQYPGRDAAGILDTVSIGIACHEQPAFRLLDDRVRRSLRRRTGAAHKGLFGHVLVVAGGAAMPGAAVLAASSALRSGAGLVTVTRFVDAPPTLSPPELMFMLLDGNSFDPIHLTRMRGALSHVSSLVVGPGIGRTPETRQFLLQLLPEVREHGIPIVIDADALNLLVGEQEHLSGIDFVLTPHPGEAARLLRTSSNQIQEDRFTAVEKMVDQYGGVVVLKGAFSLICSEEGGWVNTSGTPYLATAGSGDVLAGVIGSFLAQGYGTVEASKLGVFLHGRAGERATKRKGGPIIASDVIEELPNIIGK